VISGASSGSIAATSLDFFIGRTKWLVDELLVLHSRLSAFIHGQSFFIEPLKGARDLGQRTRMVRIQALSLR
jgi:hypothetical protein